MNFYACIVCAAFMSLLSLCMCVCVYGGGGGGGFIPYLRRKKRFEILNKATFGILSLGISYILLANLCITCILAHLPHAKFMPRLS